MYRLARIDFVTDRQTDRRQYHANDFNFVILFYYA